MNTRAGKFLLQSGGYSAFIPTALPPNPPVEYDEELQSLLSKADRELARLDGITTVLPNPDLFIAAYRRDSRKPVGRDKRCQPLSGGVQEISKLYRNAWHCFA
jgi:hypothetical protein